jgi:hypothetical protein
MKVAVSVFRKRASVQRHNLELSDQAEARTLD